MSKGPPRSSNSTEPIVHQLMRTALGAVAFGVASTAAWTLCGAGPLDPWQQMSIFGVSAAAWVTSSWSLSP